MIAVVDTCVWSLALRRAPRSLPGEAAELAELVREGRAALIGPVRQELLSGIQSPEQFEVLRDYLRGFSDIELETSDFEVAAEFFNRCRGKGIQGSNTDFLICAAAHQRRQSVFTTDTDFARFAKIIPVILHVPRT